jgi:hypothetical protein
MNDLPIELINIVSNKLRYKSLYDCLQLSSFIQWLNIKDPYFTIIKDQYLTKYFYNNKLHRIDGPAVEWSSGDKLWYKNGKLHRINNPAIEWINGDKCWYKNDELYYVEEKNGNKSWFKNGDLYRETSPAEEYINSDQ